MRDNVKASETEPNCGAHPVFDLANPAYKEVPVVEDNASRIPFIMLEPAPSPEPSTKKMASLAADAVAPVRRTVPVATPFPVLVTPEVAIVPTFKAFVPIPIIRFG